MLIYLIRNTINGKAYIGQTIRSLKVRWCQHVRQSTKLRHKDALHTAICKYGAEAFEIAVLDATATTLEELDNLERFHIKEQRTLWPHGYNLTTGGFRGRFKRSAETIAKLLERTNSPTFLKMMSERMKGNRHAKGYKHTSEARARIAAANKGNRHAKGNSPPNKGKKMSEEQREKLRAAWKIRRARPNHVHPLLGHRHSEETRAKISAATKAAMQAKKVIHAVA